MKIPSLPLYGQLWCLRRIYFKENFIPVILKKPKSGMVVYNVLKAESSYYIFLYSYLTTSKKSTEFVSEKIQNKNKILVELVEVYHLREFTMTFMTCKLLLFFSIGSWCSTPTKLKINLIQICVKENVTYFSDENCL